jgi:hypothetical protein
VPPITPLLRRRRSGDAPVAPAAAASAACKSLDEFMVLSSPRVDSDVCSTAGSGGDDGSAPPPPPQRLFCRL